MEYSIYRFYVMYGDNLKGTFGSTDFMSGLLTPAHLTYTKTRREVNSLLPRVQNTRCEAMLFLRKVK
ncbi:hypothetical protein AAEU28_15275 [Pseudoalteromonas sp. SS15]